METKIIFNQFSEVPAADLNALQDGVETSVDAIVAELLFDEGRYTNLAVSKSAALELTIGKGRYIKAGKVYRKDEVTTESLASLVPSANSRIVLVIAGGQEVDTETATRKFLIDAVTRQTQPRSVATRTERQVLIDLVAGAASASPVRPAVPTGYVAVASLTLSPSGIVGNPIMLADNKALSLETAVSAIALLQANDKKFSAMMATLRSDLAGLSKQVRTKADQTTVDRVRVDVVTLRERLDIPDTFSFWGNDSFATDSETDEAFGGYTALVDGGALHPGENAGTTKTVALLTPSDAKLDQTGALALPVYDEQTLISIDEQNGQVGFASYGVATLTAKRLNPGRIYLYYGQKPGKEYAEAELAENPAVRLKDPVSGDFVLIDLSSAKYRLIKTDDPRCWKLMLTAPYWDYQPVEVTTTGARIAQTFFCSQSGWYTSVDLGFTAPATTGGAAVHIKICELTDAGTPDLDSVLANTTVAAADLQTWPDWTHVPLGPVFLRKGQRYAVVIVSTGNHFLGTALTGDYTQGTLLASTDGTTWDADLGADLVMQLNAAKFRALRRVIELEDITLASGITQLSWAFTGVEPSGTDIILQGRVGGVWRTIGTVDDTILTTAPTQVQLRMVLLGTRDVQPGIDLTKSRVWATHPRVSSVHVSSPRTLPVGATTTSVTVREVSRTFSEALHDWGCKLLTGAGYATEVAASTVRTSRSADGAVTRTWVFTGLPAINAYRIQTTLTLTDITKPFAVTWRSDAAA